MVGLSLSEWLDAQPSTNVTNRYQKLIAHVSNNKKTYLSDKELSRRTGLSVHQIRYVFKRYPKLKELRRSRKL